MPAFGVSERDPQVRRLRARILEQLIGLYRDPYTRTQFQRFAFAPAEQHIAEGILRTLARHLLIEEKMPGIARLTDLGFRMTGTDFSGSGTATVRAPGASPDPELIRRIATELGGADYVSVARVIEGQLVITWAEGLEDVIGYSVDELEAAGGWPVVIRHSDDRDLARLFEDLLSGKPATGETTLVHRSGRRVGIRFLSWPVWNDDRTAVEEIIGAGRVLPAR